MSSKTPIHQLTYASKDDPMMRKLIIQLVEILTGGIKIQRLYEEMQCMKFESHEAWSVALKQLKISAEFDISQLEKLPKEGPIILIANHPFGVVDGLIMADLVATSPGIFSEAEELQWKRFVAKLVIKTKATVLPVFVHGQNSRLFQIASRIDASFRLGLLLNEVRNKMDKEIKTCNQNV